MHTGLLHTDLAAAQHAYRRERPIAVPLTAGPLRPLARVLARLRPAQSTTRFRSTTSVPSR